MVTQPAAPDVAGLLERVIADPVAICERILQQLLEQLTAEFALGGEGGPPEEALAVALGNRLAQVVLDPHEPPLEDWPAADHQLADRGRYEELLDRNTALAAALGACDCWGDDVECAICGGAGTPGWVPPDKQLFASYVHPALRALTRRSAAPTAGPQNAEDDPKEGGDV